MNLHVLVEKVRAELQDEPGWERPSLYHFRHPQTQVQIFIYGSSVSLVFDPAGRNRYEHELTTKTCFYPNSAIAAILEAARALVSVRMLAAAAGQVVDTSPTRGCRGR